MRQILWLLVALFGSGALSGCESAPEQIAEEKAEFDRRMKENIDAIMKRTAPKNPGQVPADAVPGERE